MDSENIILKPSIKLVALYTGLFLIVLATKLFLLWDLEHFEFFWRGGVLLGFAVLSFCYLKRVTTTYSLNPIEITGTVGILSRTVTRIPLNRITNYETYSSLAERIIGLADVMIDTPGGAGFELRLLELNRKDAEKITRKMRELIAQQKIADAGSNSQLRELRKNALNGQLAESA